MAPTLRPVSDPDVWWHLAAGRSLLGGPAAVFDDLWSFGNSGTSLAPLSPGAPAIDGAEAPRWINHEWLAEGVLALASSVAGDLGLTLLAALLLGLTGLLLCRTATRDGLPPFLAAAFIALAAAASSDRFIPRPQLFSYLGVAFLLDSLSRARRSGRLPWELVPAQIIWSNAHGAVLGLLFGAFLILGGALPTHRLQDRLRLYGALLLASFVHPQGPLPLWDNLIHLAGGGLYRTTVREWLPLFDPLQKALPQAPATWGLIVLALGGAALALRRRDTLGRPGPLLLLLLAGLAPLAAVRNRDLTGLLLAPLLATLGAGGGPLLGGRAVTLVAASAAVALIVLPAAGVGRYPPLLPLRPGLSTESCPVDAVDFLRREPVGRRIFNVYDHGGYLIHELWPGRRVFIDGRYFVYGEARYREYLELRDGAPDAAARLARHGADLLLLRYPAPDGYMALALLAQSWPDWHLVYWDDDVLLYARDGAASASWLEAHAYRHAHPLVASGQISTPEWWQDRANALARECLRAAAEAPNAQRPLLALALTLDYSGRDGQSALAYQEALRRHPNSRPAREGLERLRLRNPAGLPDRPTLADLANDVGFVAPPAARRGGR